MNEDVRPAWPFELSDRLERASSEIAKLAAQPDTSLRERDRLRGKVEGVKLALGYLREMRR